jgi:hypothetical protein
MLVSSLSIIIQLYDLLICIRYSVSPVAFSVPHTFIWHFCAIQYRFLVDGVWRCDETKPFVRDEYGLISNEVLVENNVQPVVQPEPSIRGTNMDKGTILKTVCLRSLTLYFLVLHIPDN